MDASGENYRMLVLPDHPTPICVKTHTSDPVPYVLYDSRNKEEKGGFCYNEAEAQKTGKLLENVNFEQVRGLSGVRHASIDLNGFELKVGIAHGLGNARQLLEDIRHGRNEYHVIEIMACPGGCIGGGGQPWHHGHSEILYARANALYREDANKPLRKSHENPYIKVLYEEFLGKPLSERAEHLLHTHYFNKSI